MLHVIIAPKRLVKKLNKDYLDWTWARWPNPSTVFYGYDVCKKLGNNVLRHKIVDWNPPETAKV